MRRPGRTASLAILTAGLASAWTACRSAAPDPIVLPHVELARLMGDWYVIADIPTPFVKDAYNAVQSYSLNEDGSVATTFSFNEGGFDGKKKTLKPRAYIREDTYNAEWGLQLGPILAEYLIAYVNTDYTQAVIARTSRDFVFIMARTPAIPDSEYDRLVEQVGRWGYDTEKIQRVPQQW
jgi:apolipoprotein D and lipocalin family protein